MNERAENLGRRYDLRQQRKRIEAKGEALRDQVRRMLNPADNLADLERDKFMGSALALEQSVLELQQIDGRLAVLNRELGE